MKYSICINAYQGEDVFFHLNKIKEHGLHGLELYNWAALEDLRAIAREQERLGVGIIATCTRFFNLVDGSKREEYLESLKKTLEACQTLGTKSIITQAGQVMHGISREKQTNDMVETLKQCASLCKQADVVLEVEPLNGLVNHPGHFLQYTEESVKVIDRVDSPHVKLVFDVYHQQIMEGNVTRNATNFIDRINHYHIADNPGRAQPGTGELNYVNILKAIKATGFNGYVGLECNYTTDTDAALNDFKQNIMSKVEG